MSFKLVPIDFSARIKSTSLSFRISALVMRAISVHDVKPIIKINVLTEGCVSAAMVRINTIRGNDKKISIIRMTMKSTGIEILSVK